MSRDWGTWWYWVNQKLQQLLGLSLGVAALFFGLTLVAKRYDKRSHAPASGPPSFFERAISVAWLAPLRMMPVVPQ